MKSYYHAHETAYQRIKSEGLLGWGNAKALSDLGDEKTFAYLSNVVSKSFPVPKGKKALDVGCGTGTTAFTLGKLGFDVMGIDISQTAIDMAMELALQQNLKIQFAVQDILDKEKSPGKFDLIYDSHCLHCIVFEEDRTTALINLKRYLMPDGIFILDTMIMSNEKLNPAEGFDSLRFDENFILWHKTKPSSGYGIVELEGQFWCAQRRIYPSEIIMDEVKAAGFQVLEMKIDEQVGQPSMLRLVLC